MLRRFVELGIPVNIIGVSGKAKDGGGRLVVAIASPQVRGEKERTYIDYIYIYIMI